MSKIESSAYEATDQLTASGAGAGADFMIANQSGDDKKMTLTQLATFMNANIRAAGTALTAADAVTLDATYNATEQTTVSNMRVRINEIEAILVTANIIAS